LRHLCDTMKQLLFLTIICLLFVSPSLGQNKKSPKIYENDSNLIPQIIVSPVYPDVMIQTKVSGKVIISIKVNKKGEVTEAKFIQGVKSLSRISENAAKSWVFNSSVKNATRTGKLTFIYKLIPADSPYSEANIIYFSPFTMEIKGKLVEIEP
jgi:hypothetical protein